MSYEAVDGEAFFAGKLGKVGVWVNASGSSFAETAYWSASVHELCLSREVLSRDPAKMIIEIECLLAERGVVIDKHAVELLVADAQTRAFATSAHAKVQRQLAAK